MKLYSENDEAQAWIGTQKEPWIIHSKWAVDSRAGLSMELLKCAVRSGGNVPSLPSMMCDMSAAIHAEWQKRGWTIPTPPMDTTDDNPVGFERGK